MGIVVAIAGCGGGGGGGGDQPTAEAACGAWAGAYCEREEACEHELFLANYGSHEDCVRIFGRVCPTTFNLPGTSDSPARTAACAEATSKAACEVFLSTDVCDFPPGSLKDGAPCLSGVQCKSEFCARTSATGCGVCGSPPGEGQPCYGGCQPGLSCSSTGDEDSKCRRVVGEGDSCDIETTTCEYGLGCRGTCQRPHSQGGACESSNDCAGWLTCQRGTCQPARFVPAGGACDANVDFCIFGFCQGNICLKEASAGEPCAGDGPYCELYLACERGRCVFPETLVCQ